MQQPLNIVTGGSFLIVERVLGRHPHFIFYLTVWLLCYNTFWFVSTWWIIPGRIQHLSQRYTKEDLKICQYLHLHMKIICWRFHMITLLLFSTFTWDSKWTQTGLKFHFEGKFYFSGAVWGNFIARSEIKLCRIIKVAN